MTETRDEEQGGFRRAWLGLVVVALVAGGAWLLLRGDPASTGPRVSQDEAVFGGPGSQGVISVAAGGPGLVAVGQEGSNAAVWHSTDGINWSRVAHDEALFGGPGSQVMTAVAAGVPGLVAVGLDASGGDTDAAVWHSVDGITWSRVAHDEEVFGGLGQQAMASVAAGGPGLVAVGSDPVGAAVWTSADGITWSRAVHDETVFGGPDDQWMESVVAGGPGLVAVGIDWSGGLAAAVWTSTDGITWSRVPDEAPAGGMDDQWMESVVAGGPGLVAVGTDWSGGVGDTDAAVWTSTDGITWSRIAHEAVFGGTGSQEMKSVTVGGPGLVAVGTDSVSGDTDAAVWTSTDGITWSRVPHDETVFGGTDRQEMNSVTGGGPGLVAVGTDWPSDDADGPSDDADGMLWTSTDGITWSR